MSHGLVTWKKGHVSLWVLRIGSGDSHVWVSSAMQQMLQRKKSRNQFNKIRSCVNFKTKSSDLTISHLDLILISNCLLFRTYSSCEHFVLSNYLFFRTICSCEYFVLSNIFSFEPFHLSELCSNIMVEFFVDGVTNQKYTFTSLDAL